MPIPLFSNKISSKPNRVIKHLESKETKKSKTIVKTPADTDKEVKHPLRRDVEKCKKAKLNTNKSDVNSVQIKIKETVPVVSGNSKVLKKKGSQKNLNENKRTESKISEIIVKTELPLKKKNIRISISRNEVIPNSKPKMVKKVKKPKIGKPLAKIEDTLKRSTGGTHDEQEVKKEIKKKNKVMQNQNLRKSSSQIGKELRIKSEQAAMQREILENQKIDPGKLPNKKDLDKNKKNKTDKKMQNKAFTAKFPIPSTTEAEQKKNKGILLKEPTDSFRRKQRMRGKILPKKTLEEKVNLKREVKFDTTTDVAEVGAPEKQKQEPLESKAERVKPTISKAPTITQETPSTSVARPDLLKFVRAMKENVKFDSIQPGTEPYQDLVQSTLKSVFSTVNKFSRKDPFAKFRSYGTQNDDAFMITPNLDAPLTEDSSRVTTAAQMFQQRANIAQTSQPLQRALNESRFAELKFLEKRKTQAQPEKPSFLKSLHVGPKFSEKDTSSISKAPKDGSKVVTSETGI